MDKHEFPLILQQHLVVSLDRHLEHVIVELVAYETWRGNQYALYNVEIDVSQDGLHYIVVELRQTLQLNNSS